MQRALPKARFVNDSEDRPRNRDHLYKKGGPKPPGSGRKKGTPNKRSRELSEAILAACNNLGLDLKGYGGTTGFFMRVGIKSPSTLANLAGRLLPLKIQAKVSHGVDLSRFSEEEIAQFRRLLMKGQVPLLQDMQEVTDVIDTELSPESGQYVAKLGKLSEEVDDEDKDDDGPQDRCTSIRSPCRTSVGLAHPRVRAAPARKDSDDHGLARLH